MAPRRRELEPQPRIQRRRTLLDPEQPIGNTRPSHTANGGSGSENEYAARRTAWNLNADELIKKLNVHESFKLLEGYNMIDLPRFSDLIMYNVTEAEQLELWSHETRRLVNIVNAGKPIELEGLHEWFGAADRDGYNRLDKLAMQLVHAADINIQDNEIILLEYAPEVANGSNFRTAKRRLLQQYGPGAEAHEVQGSIRLEEENDRCFQAVVNYLTGVLAQVLVRVVHADFWDENCIIAVAKLAAKLKVVGFDIQNAAAISIAAEKEWQNRIRRRHQEYFPAPGAKEDRTTRDIQLEALQRDDVHKGYRYFNIMDSFHQAIGVLMQHVVGRLGSNTEVSMYSDVFESSSVMYDTGFRGLRTMLCQERTGAIGATSHRGEVHCADFASEVCLGAFENLQKTLQTSTRTSGAEKAFTLVYWKWTEISSTQGRSSGVTYMPPRTGEMKLRWMRDVITALIPYTMICGEFPGELRSMVVNAMRIADPIHNMKMCSEVRYLAAFMIRTSEYAQSVESSVTTVSASTVAQKRALAHGSMSSTPWSGLVDHAALTRHLQEENIRLSKGLDIVETWTIDEKSILIPYRSYCYGSLGFCATLIVGGLGIGLSVQQRIHGVDPFNISIFCWTAAAFLILFLKSIRVENWPWRDFFYGRVVCRSISEVRDVTRMEPQLLLSILLLLEPRMFLSKRGPFATLFGRRADDGFSIDIPVTTKAMNEGGCFFIKVVSVKGPALVCIRAPQGQHYRDVKPHSRSEGGTEAKCPNMDDRWKWGKGETEKPLYHLSAESLTWARVVGLFCEDAYF